MPLPDRDSDPTEAAVPWRLLTRAGDEVVVATEQGGAAPAADPVQLKGVVFGRSVTGLLAERRTTCLPKYLERSAYLGTLWKLGRYVRTYLFARTFQKLLAGVAPAPDR